VDPKALYDALSSRRIRGAALDVTEPEPIAPDDPLLTCDNLLVAPHVATGTWETRKLMTDLAVRNLMAGLQGRPLAAYANPDVKGKERKG
jgi:phosphoglycerate dehydrogenase-like enzyme